MFNRSWIRNLFPSRTRLTIRKAPHRFRPVVEALEARWVPATIVVNNSTDTPVPGQIDLRQAIAIANWVSEATTIEFAPGIEEITLLSDGLGNNGLQLTNANYPITINGANSPNNVVVQTSNHLGNNHVNHLFFVATGVQATFNNLGIADGFNESPIHGGAGLLNFGTVNMTNCAFINNVSLFGGAIDNWGTATLTNCRFNNNQAYPSALDPLGSGGAIYNQPQVPAYMNPATLTLTNCTFSGNTAASYGGAIYNQGDASLYNCTIQENTAGIDGGGLFNKAPGFANLKNCVISGNKASGSGGGVANAGITRRLVTGHVNLILCTVSGNSAEDGGGVASHFGDLYLAGTTITRNTASRWGGGLFMAQNNAQVGTANLGGCTISGNSAKQGGGLELDSGTTSNLTDCTVTSNTATDYGGGLVISGTANLKNCTVSSNTATTPGGGYGGGVYSTGTATLTSSTVYGNTATYAGGGLYSDGTVTLNNCTVSSNAATSYGGGFYNDGTAKLVSSTFVNNIAGTSSSQGGGFYNNDSATLQSCTFTQNRAGAGGGLYDNDLLSLISTIVANNHAYNSKGHDVSGPDAIYSGTRSLGYNLIGNTDASSTKWLTTDLTGGENHPVLDPMLGPLANNGGPTLTMALLRGSPAINHGTQIQGIVKDQRGLPLNSPPDIGAFQTQRQTPLPHVPALAVGAGPGMEPRVNVYDGAGTLIRSFNAYESSFLGGVHVVTTDVTGDNIPDTITAPGFGGGPVVRIWDGANGSLVNEFNAYDPQFRGGVNLAVARLLDTLGSPTIITGAGPSGGPHVKVFNLQTGAVLASFLAYDSSFTGGISVAGTAATAGSPGQIITGAGPGGGPHIRVFSADGAPQGPGFMAYDLAFRGGVNVAVLRNGDIITAPASNGGPVVRQFSLSGAMNQQFLAYDAAFFGGVSLGVIPFGPESGSAILTGAGSGGGPHVQQFEAGNLSTPLHSFMAFDPVFTGGVFVG